MKNIVRNIPGYTPITPEDLRLFPDGISWFIGNIIIMLIAIAFCSMLFAINFLDIRPDVYVGLGFGLSLVISVLCILITRGHQFPIVYLRMISAGLIVLAIISGFIFLGERGNILHWLGLSAAIVSFSIVSSARYRKLAEFYKRMMERQFSTGLTRAEDIMIHLLLEEGTKEGFENARHMVINAQERIKKSPH